MERFHVLGYGAKLLASIRFKTAFRTDERVGFMDEVFSGIQIIKMFAWEVPFSKLISGARRAELEQIQKNVLIIGISISNYVATNRLALFCTILSMFAMFGSDKMLLSRMFMISFVLTEMTNAMIDTFAVGLGQCSKASVAIKRMQMFLEYYEHDQSTRNVSEELDSRGIAIWMEGASVEWTTDSEVTKSNSYKSAKPAGPSFKLQGIDLKIPKGKLVFVIGPVGAGKSTLIQALLSELPLSCGSMAVNGSLSYASQESWIFTSTIRQNITFGQPMDRVRYDSTINCSSLKTDFEQFNSGDMTMVGENGAGLSGGQKARINLARAVYRMADIYLIDDPLSAVDTHVQSHLFEECLGPNGFLARQNATRILITHQVHFLKEADWIIVLKEVDEYQIRQKIK